jgi:hypothetical protein
MDLTFDPFEAPRIAHHRAIVTLNDASMTSRRSHLPTRRFPLLVEPPAGIQPATPGLRVEAPSTAPAGAFAARRHHMRWYTDVIA